MGGFDKVFLILKIWVVFADSLGTSFSKVLYRDTNYGNKQTTVKSSVVMKF